MSAATVLQSLFRYKAWTNAELFAGLAKLDAEKHATERHTAIRLMNHIYVVDRIFAGHLMGQPHGYTGTNTTETPTLEGLRDAHTRTLQTLAAFRMPATWETLCAVLVGADEGKPCTNLGELAGVLTELEDRGLVGWEKVVNRYDLHPIVRGVIWGGLADSRQHGVYSNLHTHFESVPTVEEEEIGRLEDLTPTIELFNTLIGLKRFDDAFVILDKRLAVPLFGQLGNFHLLTNLSEMLFPNGANNLSALADLNHTHLALATLGVGYIYTGKLLQGINKLKDSLLTSNQVTHPDPRVYSFSAFINQEPQRLTPVARRISVRRRRYS